MNPIEPAILDALPHRPPFRFLSAVTELRPGECGSAVWRVRGDEAFLAGHFPGGPLVPGVLITEALAQLSGLVAFFRPDERAAGASPPRAKLVHVDVRFKEAIAPPAEILLTSRMCEAVGVFRQFEVEATCRDSVAARGRITLAQSPGIGEPTR